MTPHRPCDCDEWHDSFDGVSDLHQLTPDQAECARILGWGKRLSRTQWRVLQDLCEWHGNGTTEEIA